MANEITLTFKSIVINGNAYDTIAPGVVYITQTAQGGPSPGYLTVGTSEETVSLSEISTLGMCYIRNLDTTNYIEVGASNGVYLIKLKAKEFAWIRLKPGITVYIKANTAACKVEFKCYED